MLLEVFTLSSYFNVGGVNFIFLVIQRDILQRLHVCKIHLK